MSMKDLELAVLAELREVTGNRRIRLKDITEWSTGPVAEHSHETRVFLPMLLINVAYIPPPTGKKSEGKCLGRKGKKR